MTGVICTSVIPFYDSSTGKNSYKKRPVLVISGPRNNDYSVLPLSTISRKENLDEEYDIMIDPSIYPKLMLQRVCYVRTHKQTVVHRSSLTAQISNIKDEYEELYLAILMKLEQYNKYIMENALN